MATDKFNPYLIGGIGIAGIAIIFAIGFAIHKATNSAGDAATQKCVAEQVRTVIVETTKAQATRDEVETKTRRMDDPAIDRSLADHGWMRRQEDR